MKVHKNETPFIRFLENVVPSLKVPVAQKNIVIEKIKVNIVNLPDGFKGFTICHISDIHNALLFDENPQILSQLQKEKIDITVISGDLAHDNNIKNSSIILDQINSFCSYSNIYISAGNHDIVNYEDKKIQDTSLINNLFTQNGSVFLRNEKRTIIKNKDVINIIGIDDPELQNNENEFIDNELKKITQDIPNNQVKILISHRPEKINIYAQNQIDLVFSGHAHGGQIILSHNQGLISPNQGFIPKYTNGLYQYGKTQMVVSPGVSNSYSIPRFNNPGKIFLVELN